jgi:phosphoribosylamine---glycine ligase
MNVLIIGNGGREYSIALAIKKSKQLDKLYFAPGNGATGKIAENIAISGNKELADFVQNNNIDFTIVGPEAPLSDGIVNEFRSRGLKVFGPTKAGAALESSKAFMKNLIAKYGIPTAKYVETDNIETACAFADSLSAPIVVKADGLCAGKGVIIAMTHDEAREAITDMLSGDSFGDAGKRVVIEEFLDGYELSVFALTDGKNYQILPAAQDHKRLKDNDEGPNTGGMGAYAPTPLATAELMKKIEERIIKPTVDAMAAEGSPFEGVLFAGIMVVNDEPITLEFNVRFGDPECEELMTLIESDPLELFLACAEKKVDTLQFKINDNIAVGVVAASKDYPYKNSVPAKISVDESKLTELAAKGHICYAGVELRDGELYATGGRVLISVGVGKSVKEARDNAYELMNCVCFDGMQYRRDIAYQALR